MCNMLLALCALSCARFALGTISLTPPTAVPSGASGVVSPSFAGFGIEPSNLFAYAGNYTVNQLSVNLLQNLADYTGKPPHLRIGGNTGDYIVYEPSYSKCRLERNPSSGPYHPDEYIIGPCYFEAMNRFPKGTPITYGLNLALDGEGYLDLMVDTAAAARDRLTNVNLVSFEIGNEPDLYLQNGFRKAPWDGDIYTAEWLERADAVWSNVLQGNIGTSQFFEPGCTASTTGATSNGTGATFQITELIDDGIVALANGSSKSYVAGFNQHDYYYYIGVSAYPLDFEYFTDLWTMTYQLTAWKTQLAESRSAGYPYYLREMGVVGPVGLAGITDTFAASLWTLNFFLYAASIGIAQVNMHMTENSNASAWQAIPWLPYSPKTFVRPNYYAFAAMAQIIGKECSTQIAQLNITHTEGQPPSYDNRIVAYNSYKSGTLAAIILINTQIANVSDTSKNSLTFSLDLPDFAGQELYLSYLTNIGADALTGTTWNGTSYEQNGDGTATVVDDTVNTVLIGSDGSVTVTIRDSQAVVANIGSFVGTGEANAAACAAFADVTPQAHALTSSSTHSSASSTHHASSTASAASTHSASTSGIESSTGTSTGSSAAQTTSSSAAGSRVLMEFVLLPVIGVCLTLL